MTMSDDVIASFLRKIQDKDVPSAIARREFRRCDQKNLGRVTISDFKTVSRRLGVSIDSEEIYKIATLLDQNCTGTY